MFSKNKLFKSLSTCAAFSILGTNFLQAKGSATLNNTKSTLNYSRPVAKKGRSNKKIKNKRSVAQTKAFNLNKIINDVSKFLGHLNFNKIINDIYKFASSPLVYPSLLTFPPVLLAILLSSDGDNSKIKKNNKKLPNKPGEKKSTSQSPSHVNESGSGEPGGAYPKQMPLGEYEEWSEEDRDFLVGCLVIFFIVAAVLFLIFKPNRLPSESELDKWEIGFIDNFGILHTDISDQINKNKNKGNNILKNINKFKKVFYKRIANGTLIKEGVKEQEEFIPDSVSPEENKEININKKIKEEYGINEDKYKYKGVYEALPVLRWKASNCSVLSAFYLMYSPEYKYFYCILRMLCKIDEELLLKCLNEVLKNKSTKIKKPFLFSEIGWDGTTVYKKFERLSTQDKKNLLKFYIEKKLGPLEKLPSFEGGESAKEMEDRVIGTLRVGNIKNGVGFGTLRAGSQIQAVDTLKCFGFFIGDTGGEFQEDYNVEEFKGIDIGEFFTNSKILHFYWGTTTDSALLGEKKEDAAFIIKQCDKSQGDEGTIYLKLDSENFIDGPLPVVGHFSFIKEKWELRDLENEFPAQNGEVELFKIFEKDEKEYYRKELAEYKKNNPEKYQNYTEEEYIMQKILERRKNFPDKTVKDYIGGGYLPLSVAKRLVKEKIEKDGHSINGGDYEKMWSHDTVFHLDPPYKGDQCVPVLGKSVTVSVKKKKDDEKGCNFGYGKKQKVYIAAISVYSGSGSSGHWYCLQPKYKWNGEKYVISKWVKLSCLGYGHEFLNKDEAKDFLMGSCVTGLKGARKGTPVRIITQKEIEACPEYYIMDEEGNMGEEKDIRPGALEENKGGYIPPEWRAAFKNYEENGATTQGEKNENNINNGFDINTNSNLLNEGN